MKNIILRLSVLLLISFFVLGCQKEKPLETDPAKIILGKWDLIQTGFSIIEEPYRNREFFSDSTVLSYSYKTGEKRYFRYWIDSLYTEGSYTVDGELITTQFSYAFSDDNNQLELIIINAYVLNSLFIYKRINY